MIISTQLVRFVHLGSTKAAVQSMKANLATLRKKTGYPFGNCKKALESNNNDVEKAEKWLEEQAKALGWSKAMKMESRNTPQGLVGVAWDKHYAAMVEVNCETDFVGKNDKFQKLVDMVAKTCLHHIKDKTPATSFSKVILDGNDVGKLLAEDKQSLSDHMIKNIALVGEKLQLRRAALVSGGAWTMAALTHPTTAANCSTLLGKYGAILLYSTPTHTDKTNHLAKQLCQHIIGMNPKQIEPSPDEPAPVAKPPKEKKPLEGDAGDGDGTELVADVGEVAETVMLRQMFLLDDERSVADVITEAGIKIQDFVRFECGEEITDVEDSENIKIAQAGG